MGKQPVTCKLSYTPAVITRPTIWLEQPVADPSEAAKLLCPSSTWRSSCPQPPGATLWPGAFHHSESSYTKHWVLLTVLGLPPILQKTSLSPSSFLGNSLKRQKCKGGAFHAPHTLPIFYLVVNSPAGWVQFICFYWMFAFWAAVKLNGKKPRAPAQASSLPSPKPWNAEMVHSLQWGKPSQHLPKP